MSKTEPATNFDRGRTALVTGATGFIGRRLMELLRADGWKVIACVRSQNKAAAQLSDVDEFLECDLCGDDEIIVPENVDTVFHLAGKAHAILEVGEDESEYERVNTVATKRMLDAAAKSGVRAFVYFSSVKAVEDPRGLDGPADETWSGEPDTAYGRSKRAAEAIVLGDGGVSHVVVLRPSLVYGPDPKGNLAKMADAVRRGRFPSIPETGNKRSAVHLDDVCRAAMIAADHPSAHGKVFIAADDTPFSSRMLYEWMCDAVGRQVPRWRIPLFVLRVAGVAGDAIGRLTGRRFVFDTQALDRLTESAWYSGDRLKNDLGWRPERTLRDSLVEMVEVPGE